MSYYILVSISKNNLDLCGWSERNLKPTSFHEGLVPWNVYFPFAIWNLWLHRNNVVFKGNHPKPGLGKSVSQAANEYFFCAARNGMLKRSKLIMVRWNRPSSGWYKLNTDGLALGNLDSNGLWVKGFTGNIGHATSVDAKLWALRDGLTLWLALNIVAVEIEIDAKVLRDWTTSEFNCKLNHSSYYGLSVPSPVKFPK
ncbi:hypothetical protein SO802_001919 [Lithocarpus litseifolius]|uniref:RNase H type-1 domain-containing protein n=1 Tax=Lithocarpus litseifolius TaxID=425828 RepID=A0AAW2DVR4_9ROSI